MKVDAFIFLQKLKIPFFILISFIVVTLGQPALFGWLGYLSAGLGYALFWHALFSFNNKKVRFFLSWIWFSLVHAVGISWMTSTGYVGAGFYVVYFFIVIAIGAQFAIFCQFFSWKTPPVLTALFLASVWTLFEWGRLFFFSGYSWNPIGLALAANPFSVQWASLFGIYGLSFWVILTNVVGWRAFFSEKSRFLTLVWASLYSLPFIFGYFQVLFHEKWIEKSHAYSVALVQTSFFPEERIPLLTETKESSLLTPWDHWRKMLKLLKENLNDPVDLIIFPEVSVPVPAHLPLYPFQDVKKDWETIFKISHDEFFPLQEENFSNFFVAQTLANFFECEVIMGLEDFDSILRTSYNAAFFFQPFSQEAKRYKKQILVPISEYFPFTWCKEIAKKYGITGEFTPGKETKVFFGETAPIGISICYEETYGDLMRKNRKRGAKLFVNISNDVWFPSSSLPRQHFELGKIRAVENGVPLIRACNTGVTAAVDSLGRNVALLNKKPEEGSGVLLAKVPSHHYPTLYTLFGDRTILFLSTFSILVFLRKKWFTRDFYSRFSASKKNS